jgi:NodT family efflux transporter outer membrane factor (OMF) lipoprotein
MNIKNIFILFLVILIFCNTPICVAFWFENDKSAPKDFSYKFDYINIDWWENFDDPILKSYIVMALTNNQDLKIATLKTEEYRQFVKMTFGQELPEISMGSNFTAIKIPFSKDRPLNISDSGYVLPFTVKYEADLLRKNHDKTQSAKKQFEVSKFQEKATYIAICSYVATVYLNITKNDKLIALQSELVALKKEQLRRMIFRHSQGLASSMQVNTYTENYKTAKNDLNDLTKSRDKMLDELAVLIGESPECSQNLKRTSLDKIRFLGAIPNCIPSDVIFARPDVLAAEAQLQAARIDVKVARKELLPTFNINGNLGFNTFTTDTFFSWNGAFALLTAGLTQTLFAGGRRIANLRIKKNLYEQLFENYKQASLKAVQEVNDSFYAIKFDSDVDKENIEKLKLEKNNFAHSSKKYFNGVISCPELLGEKEKLIYAESQQVYSKTTRLVNYLGLYKASGGQV